MFLKKKKYYVIIYQMSKSIYNNIGNSDVGKSLYLIDIQATAKSTIDPSDIINLITGQTGTAGTVTVETEDIGLRQQLTLSELTLRRTIKFGNFFLTNDENYTRFYNEPNYTIDKTKFVLIATSNIDPAEQRSIVIHVQPADTNNEEMLTNDHEVFIQNSRFRTTGMSSILETNFTGIKDSTPVIGLISKYEYAFRNDLNKSYNDEPSSAISKGIVFEYYSTDSDITSLNANNTPITKGFMGYRFDTNRFVLYRHANYKDEGLTTEDRNKYVKASNELNTLEIDEIYGQTFLFTPRENEYGKNTAFTTSLGNSRLYVGDDGELHFINKTGNDSIISTTINDKIEPLTYWQELGEDIFTYNKVLIGTSVNYDIDENLKLYVEGNTTINGTLLADGSINVKTVSVETTLNAANFIIGDKNFQISFINPCSIENLLYGNYLHSSKEHNLSDGDNVFIQESNFTEADGTPIDGFYQVTIFDLNSFKISKNSVEVSSIFIKTFTVPKYYGVNSLSDSIIVNTSTSYTGTTRKRVRIYMTSSTSFKYSLDSGFRVEGTQTSISINTNYNLIEGIVISFTSISNLSEGDYWEFLVVPPVQSGTAVSINNFSGEFGKILNIEDVKQSGFEIIAKDSNNNLVSRKLDFNYVNSELSYFKFNDSLKVNGDLEILDDVIVRGNLDVIGTSTFKNLTSVIVADKNFQIGTLAQSINSCQSDGSSVYTYTVRTENDVSTLFT